ncbi:MAG: hypothetical protein HYR62_03790 [Actinobacteria bacterium]|nr:hypothetical protein [Actinomycetota bacterium]MBI3687747.1 hypothetical protein [Actinomycetota bacterium]
MFNIDDSFLMPDGARLVGRDADTVSFAVAMPVDERGFFGRQCPGCRLVFRIDADAFKAMADDAEMWCVYCGHCEGLGEFITQQQLERATSVVGDWGLQHMHRELGAALSGLARPAPRSGWGIGVEVHVDRSPFYPRPLPGISEEHLIRVRTHGCGKVRRILSVLTLCDG